MMFLAIDLVFLFSSSILQFAYADEEMKKAFKTVGVNPTDNMDEIRKAFRKKLFEVHTDIPGNGDNEKMREATDAFKVLEQEKRRKEYVKKHKAKPYS